MDLLPASVDVPKNISGMKGNRQERKQTKDSSEDYDRPNRWLVRAADLLVAFPKQEQ